MTTRRRTRLLVALGITFSFLLGVLWVVAGPSPAHGAGLTQPILRVPWFSTAHLRARICNPTPPEWPGCTERQIRDREASSKRAARHHYAQWYYGQRRHRAFAHLSPAAETKLRKGYRRAVHRYELRHKRGARPMYLTWSAFKSATDCAGTFGSPSPLSWCMFTSSLDRAIRHTEGSAIHETFFCGGAALGAGVSGFTASKMLALALYPEAWAVSGFTGCLSTVVYYHIDPF